jgi:hypothetical protein
MKKNNIISNKMNWNVNIIKKNSKNCLNREKIEFFLSQNHDEIIKHFPNNFKEIIEKINSNFDNDKDKFIDFCFYLTLIIKHMSIKTKTCIVCDQEKDHSEFKLLISSVDGLKKKCNSCIDKKNIIPETEKLQLEDDDSE